MKISIFKSVLIGLLLGVIFFVATKVVLAVLLIGAIFKLSGKGKWKREQWKEKRMAFVENVRGMNDEEFKNFKENFTANHGCRRGFNIKNV